MKQQLEKVEKSLIKHKREIVRILNIKMVFILMTR